MNGDDAQVSDDLFERVIVWPNSSEIMKLDDREMQLGIGRFRAASSWNLAKTKYDHNNVLIQHL